MTPHDPTPSPSPRPICPYATIDPLASTPTQPSAARSKVDRLQTCRRKCASIVGSTSSARWSAINNATTASKSSSVGVRNVYGAIVSMTGAYIGQRDQRLHRWCHRVGRPRLGRRGALWRRCPDRLHLARDRQGEHPHRDRARRRRYELVRIFQNESFFTTLPSRSVHRSQPRTSIRCPSVVVPERVHSDAPRSRSTKWSSSW